MTTAVMNMMTTDALIEVLERETNYEQQLMIANLPSSEQHRLVATLKAELSDRLGVKV
jgi:hypothetical protein